MILHHYTEAQSLILVIFKLFAKWRNQGFRKEVALNFIDMVVAVACIDSCHNVKLSQSGVIDPEKVQPHMIFHSACRVCCEKAEHNIVCSHSIQTDVWAQTCDPCQKMDGCSILVYISGDTKGVVWKLRKWEAVCDLIFTFCMSYHDCRISLPVFWTLSSNEESTFIGQKSSRRECKVLGMIPESTGNASWLWGTLLDIGVGCSGFLRKFLGVFNLDVS